MNNWPLKTPEYVAAEDSWLAFVRGRDAAAVAVAAAAAVPVPEEDGEEEEQEPELQVDILLEHTCAGPYLLATRGIATFRALSAQNDQLAATKFRAVLESSCGSVFFDGHGELSPFRARSGSSCSFVGVSAESRKVMRFSLLLLRPVFRSQALAQGAVSVKVSYVTAAGSEKSVTALAHIEFGEADARIQAGRERERCFSCPYRANCFI